MQWSRSETLALALQSCTHCYGMGTRIGRLGKTSACKCVFREIFRSCLRKFEEIQRGYSPLGKLDARQNWRASLHQSFGMKNAEYSADFLLVAKRTLGADSLEYKLFRFHYLLGADWRLCSRRLGIDRGQFFHAVYRVEERLGRAFRETEPYALFPLDEYFATVIRKAKPLPAAA